ncbi:taste receptor type 2 member 117 [Mus musculus]|uniref:Taste receptor type 2 member 117 n=1 Tax=Mus musculus TaxID=10090 RepID=TR117_MOUSE|nr:taste receptor type 2 member 117 [Mus musculus]Q7M715.1 RecName: Full=Taste receptor type 2 member 117; Short=T2R117; Short=mT2R54 [Mus musculus]AAI32207.1 Taste receptor, type 2, member 117 [Mus musculus]AAI32209.1 Taste receptor, type 2, member 117 [Mus musculus]DAA01221.1 TPA_exp: candidate taste receptor mt2r54 [Mus musculus]|eukprot:NP_996904.1 taste receptor type 2 member 117 [Mus musculus]
MKHFWKILSVISQSTLSVILIVELVIGIIGNGFMVLVHCMDWVKKKKMSLVNQILTALSISRIFQLCLLFISLVINFSYTDLTTSSRMIQVMYNAWILANHFSIWIATCLTVLYFLKIANFSNSFFLYLKWRVEKVVSVTLLVSLLLLILNILLTNLETDMWTNEYQRNISCSFSSHYYAKCHRQVLRLHIIFLSVPVVLSLSTFLLLIFSLWTHHKRMQQHVQGGRDARTTAHFKALQTVIAFFLLYSIFILSVLIQIWKYELLKKNLFVVFCEVVYIAFPTFHSYILIVGDMKLRQACLPLCIIAAEIQTTLCRNFRSLKYFRLCCIF